MKHRLAQILVMAVGLVVLGIGLLIEARDVTRVAQWSGSGFVLCAPMERDSITTFFTVDTNDFISAPYPQAGDTLVSIADSAASLDRWIHHLEVAHTPGREVKITFLHDGVEHETHVRTRPVGATLKVSVFVLQILKILIFLSFVGLGFWAYFKRPHSPPVRVLSLYCFAMATFMVTVFMPMYSVMAAFRVPLEDVLFRIVASVGVFFGGFWLLLQMLFPRPVPFMQRRPLPAYALCLLPWLLFVAFAATAEPVFRLPPDLGLRFVIYPVAAIQVLAGLALLAWNHRHAQTYIEKRQTKLVLWGSGGGLVLFLIYLLDRYGIIRDVFYPPLAARMLATDLVFLILLLSPLSLAYAFGKYRLLDIEGRLRRGTRHLLTLALMLALLFAIGYYASEIIGRTLARGSFWNLAVTIVVVVAILRGAQTMQKNLERRFYPERQRLRQMIQDFLQRTASFADPQTFWNQLEERLRDSLAVEEVYPILRAGDHTFLLRDAASTPFEPSSPLVLKMEREGRPIMVDEAMSGSRVPMNEEEINWLIRNRVALLLPMVSNGRLVGFLGFGMKTEREDYAPEELSMLRSLAPQVALASDNLRLLAENLEKRRMEEELQVARRVQERFLPKDLPSTPGLSVAAKSVFCLEVAGDYYDVIALPGGRTAFAVGDVSGKGAGAALLMANVQALLRALCGLDLTLDNLMLRANELIHQNTEPDQFITLFVGVFDPDEKSLYYVNAGHNFPILIRRSGRDQMLDEGGLILGPFPDATFDQGCVRLMSGDTLLVYTDGVSEAMNESGDELGEELVRDVVRARSDESPAEIISHVMSLVNLHQGNRPPEDDQTLLAARVI